MPTAVPQYRLYPVFQDTAVRVTKQATKLVKPEQSWEAYEWKRGQLTAKRTTTVLGFPRDPRAPRDKHPGSRSLSLSQHYKARGQHQFKFVLLACKTT